MSVFETWGLFGGSRYEFSDPPMWSSTTYPVRRGIRRKRLLYASAPQAPAKPDTSPGLPQHPATGGPKG